MSSHMIPAPTMTPMTKSIRPILLLLALAACLPGSAAAQSLTIAPPPFQTVFDNSGHIVNNACVWTYQAGTTTAATTYSDTASTPNLNPIRADSAGRFTAYLLAGANYKFIYESSCTPPSHGTVLRTADNIAGVPSSSATVDITGTTGETISAGQCAYLSDGSGFKTAGLWYRCDTTNNYSSTLPEVGIAPSAILAFASGTIRIAGSVTGLSSLSVGATYYVGSTGAITATLPTNRRALGVADTATSLVLAGNPPQPTNCVVVSSAVVGAQNNFDPGITGPCTVVRMTNATLTTISGLTAGFDGQQVWIYGLGAGQIDLLYSSGLSSTGHKLSNLVTSGTTSLSGGGVIGSAEYIYDGTNSFWRLVSHNQGNWITPTFSAGNYTANGSMTFTVTSPQVTANRYTLRGRTITWAIDVGASTLGGTQNTTVKIANPASYTTFATMRGPCTLINNNVPVTTGIWAAGASTTSVEFYLDRLLVTNWTLSANTYITCVVEFEVQ